MTLLLPAGAITTTAWQPYTQTVDWALIGDVVYAQFRDRAGNTSSVYSSEGDEYEPHRIYLPLVMRNG